MTNEELDEMLDAKIPYDKLVGPLYLHKEQLQAAGKWSERDEKAFNFLIGLAQETRDS